MRSDVAVKLFGDDFEELESQAERIRRVVARVPGAADVQVEPLSGAAELRIEINRTELARYGLRVTDVAEFIETATGGRPATQVIEGRRRIDVVVRLPESRRDDPRAVRPLLVTTPSGDGRGQGETSSPNELSRLNSIYNEIRRDYFAYTCNNDSKS